MEDSAKDNNQFLYITTGQHHLIMMLSYSLSLDDSEEWLQPYNSDEYDS